MTATILKEPQVSVLDQPGWFLDLLTCPSCGHPQLEPRKRGVICPACTAGYTSHDGVIELMSVDLLETMLPQRQAWELVERMCGQYDWGPEQIDQYPLEPTARAQINWLRETLRARGRCRVLEIGAGRGWAARMLAQDGHEVVATDILDDARIGLGCAARLCQGAGYWFGRVTTPAEALSFKDCSFDIVFSFATLRHLVDLPRVLGEVERVLRPGGIFLGLDEPFRGALTTAMQRLQNSLVNHLIRWWMPGKPFGPVKEQIAAMRKHLGAGLYESCRRVPFYVSTAEEVGLRATVLPLALLLTLPPDLSWTEQEEKELAPGWLEAVAASYGVDIERLRGCIDSAHGSLGRNPVVELLNHWITQGNFHGALLAIKGDGDLAVLPQATTAKAPRTLDPLLMECAEENLVPVYGLYGMEQHEEIRFRWMQPLCGFLVPGAPWLEITAYCPGKPFCMDPVRVEVRVDDERLPALVLVLMPGKTVTFKVRIPEPYASRPSVLIRVVSALGFMPSDYTGSVFDMRLLSLQLRRVYSGPSAACSSVGAIDRNAAAHLEHFSR
jgi:ubiquinone/menaquinone biosynthesis C-methylase UbiE